MRRSACLFIGGLLIMAVHAAGPADARSAGACAVAVTASADGSFAQAGYDSSPARLSKLAAVTRNRFAAAARRLCAERVLGPSDLARFRALVVQNGEGATESLIYRTPEMARGTYVFQYAFQDGDPPPAEDFERALKCWKYPKKAGCYED